MHAPPRAVRISIHALRKESDDAGHALQGRPKDFNPRSP